MRRPLSFIDSPAEARLLPVSLGERLDDALGGMTVPPLRDASLWLPRGSSSLTSPATADGSRTSTFVPSVIVTGRSVLSRTVKHGMPNAVVSSCSPPESVTTANADCTRSSIAK